jgi:hypothetical protein
MLSTGLPQVFYRLVVLTSILVVFSLGFLLPMAAPVHAAASLDSVGARTPFNRLNALDLKNYCNGADQGDDTACIGRWIGDAAKQGKHLYVSPGTYIYSKGRAIFSGFHLQCASPTQVTFKAINNASNLFVLAPNSVAEGNAPWQDISIENCGFDFNGSTAHFAGFIALTGGTWPIQYVTVRGNKMFDRTMAGRPYTFDDPMRQHIGIINSTDVLVENNVLSQGSRIKVGRPGRRIVIRANTVNDPSENGITVSDKGSGLSSDILIENNMITAPLNSGIFFGTDGQNAGTAATQLFDVTIRNNAITGNWRNNCITGVLPNHVARIYISENTCHKLGTTPTGVFAGGIALNRNNTSTLYAMDITVHDNTILSDIYNALNNTGGIFMTDRFDNLCVLHNTIYDTRTAIRLRSDMPHVKVTGNELDGGLLSIKSKETVHVDQSGNTTGCFVASPLLD